MQQFQSIKVEIDCSLLYPFTCPHNGRRNDSCLCTDDGSAMAGLSKFSKVRVDLHNMKINSKLIVLLKACFIFNK